MVVFFNSCSCSLLYIAFSVFYLGKGFRRGGGGRGWGTNSFLANYTMAYVQIYRCVTGNRAIHPQLAAAKIQRCLQKTTVSWITTRGITTEGYKRLYEEQILSVIDSG